MSYFKICPHCGANLDPGEVCDCQIGAPARWAPVKSQTFGNSDKKTAPSAANTEGRQGGTGLNGPVSASIINENGGFVK